MERRMREEGKKVGKKNRGNFWPYLKSYHNISQIWHRTQKNSTPGQIEKPTKITASNNSETSLP